jgi:hypothetical protein
VKHEAISDRARVWTVSLRADGKLTAELDPELLARLAEARSDEQVTEVLTGEVARTRAW